MCAVRASPVALLVVALASATTRADETAKNPPVPPPDPSFLEFLGGVDGLADVNPDYLTQGNATHPGAAPPKPPVNPPPPPPPAAGAKNDD
jgi:hypothetical protein